MITRPFIGTVFELIIGCVFFGAVLFVAGCDILTTKTAAPTETEPSAGGEKPVSIVGFYTVKAEPVPLFLRQSGRIAAFNTAQVRPQVNGIILKRAFEEGAFVEKGQLLYQIDPAVYEANYQKALANQNNLERAKKRAEELKEDRAVSVQAFEDSLYAWEIAKAETELARLNLDYCQIKAPIGGKIGFSHITLGALATNGQTEPLTSIEQIDPIYVDINPPVAECLLAVRERFRGENGENGEAGQGGADGNDEAEKPDRKVCGGSMFQGAKVRIVLENGAEYPLEGTVKALCNRVQEDTGTIALRAEFPNPDGILLPGMFVRVEVEQGVRENGILIPQQALCRDTKGKPYVWVVLDAGKENAGKDGSGKDGSGKDGSGKDDKTAEKGSIVEKRTIRTDRAIGTAWLVDEGLGAGDRIVVEGLQYVSQNGNVQPIEAKNVEVNTESD